AAAANEHPIFPALVPAALPAAFRFVLSTAVATLAAVSRRSFAAAHAQSPDTPFFPLERLLFAFRQLVNVVVADVATLAPLTLSHASALLRHLFRALCVAADWRATYKKAPSVAVDRLVPLFDAAVAISGAVQALIGHMATAAVAPLKSGLL